MLLLLILVFSAMFSASSCVKSEFPTWFKFGAATAAYQVEGAWNVSDKGESVWDRYTHNDPTRIKDESNGDVACDSYHQWERDVEMAGEMGIQTYRFSVSWSRILPNGYSNVISEDGKKYYNDLIDALLAKGIEPFITIFHFDLPQNLQNIGGWTNPLIVEQFANYARVLFKEFGDRAKNWVTINEPEILCDFTYTTGTLPPGYKDPKISPYLCTKHVLLAHAQAWRIYDEEFKPMYQGKVSIPLNLIWLSPASYRDKTLTELATDYMTGRFTQPIYSKEGGFPASTVDLMREASTREGYEMSRLPDLSQDQVELIRGTFDFFALNYYACMNVRRAKPQEEVETVTGTGISELEAVLEVDPYLKTGSAVVCPIGLRQQMAWLKKNYGDLEIMITENGLGTVSDELKDRDRVNYIKNHLKQVLYSINKDKVNVTGYIYWALMDNFEWMKGYTNKFGLYQVDYTTEERTRTPRNSATYFKNIIQARSLNVRLPR